VGDVGEAAPVRLAELLAALSLGIDLGFGQPMEHVLRQCRIALRLAELVGLDEPARAAVYYSALLVNVGCHTDAYEHGVFLPEHGYVADPKRLVTLLADAFQGVQAQTVANGFLAMDAGLKIIPTLNKIDLPHARPDFVIGEMETALMTDPTEVMRVSAKAGIGIEDLLVAAALREPLSFSTRMVPVPLHPQRLQMRGFNQASIIARAISSSLQLPINEVSLKRTSHTEKYRAGLDAKGRSDTVEEAFAVVHPRSIVGEKILLVDDVFTTGATAASCSTALLGAGADTVNVLTIARTKRRTRETLWTRKQQLRLKNMV